MLQQLKTTCRSGLEPRRLEGETSWTRHQLITKLRQMIAHSHLHTWGSFRITTCTSLDCGENVQTTHRKGSWGVRTWGFLAFRQEISISLCYHSKQNTSIYVESINVLLYSCQRQSHIGYGAWATHTSSFLASHTHHLYVFFQNQIWFSLLPCRNPQIYQKWWEIKS